MHRVSIYGGDSVAADAFRGFVVGPKLDMYSAGNRNTAHVQAATTSLLDFAILRAENSLYSFAVVFVILLLPKAQILRLSYSIFLVLSLVILHHSLILVQATILLLLSVC